MRKEDPKAPLVGILGGESPALPMMYKATIPTWDLLRCLGFQSDSAVISDVSPGLSFDFGNLKLSASCVWSPRSGEVILFSGIVSTPRTLGEVDFELPRRIKSLKRCAAWIVWNLDQHLAFKQTCHIDWVEEARQNKSLLPWVRSMAEYNARPQCLVQRDWFRLALKGLRQQLSSLPDQEAIAFSFDGSVLFIRCCDKVIALPGEGVSWAVGFRVAAEKLRRLPKRFRHEQVDVSIWQSRISLGTWTYEGTVEQSGITHSSSVQ
jgi:hypothetical protein